MSAGSIEQCTLFTIFHPLISEVTSPAPGSNTHIIRVSGPVTNLDETVVSAAAASTTDPEVVASSSSSVSSSSQQTSV